MGKRKSARKPMTKVRQKLDKQFSCIFCNHEKSVDVKLDKESKVGNIFCRVCSASWQTSIHYLSEAVDVYSEWIDACEEAENEESRAGDGSATLPYDDEGDLEELDGYREPPRRSTNDDHRQQNTTTRYASQDDDDGEDEEDEDEDSELFG